MELEDRKIYDKKASKCSSKSGHSSISYHDQDIESLCISFALPLRKIFCARCPSENPFLFLSCTRRDNLARSSTRDVRALSGFLSAGEGDTAPSPAGARSLSAKDVNSSRA